MAAQTQGESISLERTRTVNRAVGESINGTATLGVLRAGGVPGGEAAAASNGFYDDGDNWVVWWRAGQPAGAAPVKPAVN